MSNYFSIWSPWFVLSSEWDKLGTVFYHEFAPRGQLWPLWVDLAPEITFDP
jgi:hypothetical protein